jgi:DNA helicase-2/ATP-dependent DNA helicase PcrA
MSLNTPEILKELNEAQIAPVIHKNGPLIVIAGAGSGKTRVLTHRIAYLIKNGIDPFEILALTFTKKELFQFSNQMMQKICGWELFIQFLQNY